MYVIIGQIIVLYFLSLNQDKRSPYKTQILQME